MSPDTGRFLSADPFEGLAGQPMSLHRFAYASNSPGNRSDPSGEFDGAVAFMAGFSISMMLAAVPAIAVAGPQIVTIVPMIVMSPRAWPRDEVDAQLETARQLWSSQARVTIVWDSIWRVYDMQYSAMSRWDVKDKLRSLKRRVDYRLPVLFTDYLSDDDGPQGLGYYGVGAAVRRCYRAESASSPDYDRIFTCRAQARLLAHELGHAIADLNNVTEPTNVMNEGVIGPELSNSQRQQIRDKGQAFKAR